MPDITKIKNVKLGIRNYSVLFVNEIEIEDAIGHIRQDTRKIRILNNIDDDEKFLVLMHELFHAISYDIGRSDFVEDLIDVMSLKAVQVFRENPKLKEFL